MQRQVTTVVVVKTTWATGGLVYLPGVWLSVRHPWHQTCGPRSQWSAARETVPQPRTRHSLPPSSDPGHHHDAQDATSLTVCSSSRTDWLRKMLMARHHSLRVFCIRGGVVCIRHSHRGGVFCIRHSHSGDVVCIRHSHRGHRILLLSLCFLHVAHCSTRTSPCLRQRCCERVHRAAAV